MYNLINIIHIWIRIICIFQTNFRAKLLHDAWNLAYAGDLSFATAFNMTLFMKYEREHLVWNPVFTFIDHIGRHIDMSKVHKKFEVSHLPIFCYSDKSIKLKWF